MRPSKGCLIKKGPASRENHDRQSSGTCLCACLLALWSQHACWLARCVIGPPVYRICSHCSTVGTPATSNCSSHAFSLNRLFSFLRIPPPRRYPGFFFLPGGVLVCSLWVYPSATTAIDLEFDLDIRVFSPRNGSMIPRKILVGCFCRRLSWISKHYRISLNTI